MPALRGASARSEAPAFYYHYYEFGAPHWAAPHYGIRTDRYKLISYYNRNEWELFDLEKDPDEMENLFAWSGYKIHPDYAAILPGLVSQLKAMREKYKDNTGKAPVLWPTKSYD